MFSRDELIHIYKHISDESLKRKIHERLFVNENVVADIKNIYSMDNLFRIEKSTYKNTYFVHLFGDFELHLLIEKAINLSDKDDYAGLDLDIDVITHENIEDIWHRKDCIQIYYTSPEQFLG